MWWCAPVVPLTGWEQRLRWITWVQEDWGCSDPWLCHYTPAWEKKQDTVSKSKQTNKPQLVNSRPIYQLKCLSFMPNINCQSLGTSFFHSLLLSLLASSSSTQTCKYSLRFLLCASCHSTISKANSLPDLNQQQSLSALSLKYIQNQTLLTTANTTTLVFLSYRLLSKLFSPCLTTAYSQKGTVIVWKFKSEHVTPLVKHHPLVSYLTKGKRLNPIT